MLDWMLLPFKRYAEFSGRSRRMEYWSFALLTFIVYIVGLVIMMVGGFPISALTDPAAASAMQEGPGALFYVGAALVGIYALAIFIPSLAVTVRRLHDRNMSGWFLLGYVVAQLIPIINIIAAIGMLVLMFLPGTPGPNKYGADPKDPASAEVFS
jgi:uncharacterized membrane protein YhaH (DUF805 family)